MGRMLLDVTLAPNVTSLPGGDLLQQVTNGIAGWALMIALIGLIVGAGMWAIVSHSNNYQQSYSGRKAVIASGGAAVVIGAAPTLVSFFFHAGQGVH